MLVGRPDDPLWDTVQCAAAHKMEQSRKQLRLNEKQKHHRRGRFPALASGISHGGGQLKPGNLDHGSNDEVLTSLMADPSLIRIAGHASAAFANWYPKLYQYYANTLESLLQHDPSTHRPYANSVWAGATFNFGPNTVCYKHRDSGNLAYGICGVNAQGSYDFRRGGHMNLWDAGYVVQFPPGTTILVPSSAIAHSNVPIQPGERRYSFTQYTSGAIFRWVDFGFKPVTQHHSNLSKSEREKLVLELQVQLKKGLGLFSTLEELRKGAGLS